jgi:hypothetical protein
MNTKTLYQLFDTISQETYQANGTWQKKNNGVLFTSRQDAQDFKANVLHLNSPAIIPITILS